MLIRLLTVSCLILLAGCGRDAAIEASATPAPAPQSVLAQPAATLERRPAPSGATAYIISPADGATVESPVRVLFGLRGAGVIPAGIEREGAGHHHLLIDTSLPNLDLPVPSDTNHQHFGAGQTEAEIDLEPGSHTMQLLLGDERHIPHDPPILSEMITIEVR